MASYVTLVQVPGSGASSVEVEDGMTVSEFVARYDLHGRNIIINGEQVPTSAFSTTTLDGAVEVFATGAVKGA